LKFDQQPREPKIYKFPEKISDHCKKVAIFIKTALREICTGALSKILKNLPLHGTNQKKYFQVQKWNPVEEFQGPSELLRYPELPRDIQK
jgi:hypothetical protein